MGTMAGWESITSERLELVSMSPAFLEALLGGRRGDAERLAGIALPDGWPDNHDLGFLRFRAGQMERDARFEQWLVRAIALRAPGRLMIGHIGFHGPPGVNERRHPNGVELGYTVFEQFRRQGYATEAILTLMAWARGRGITAFVASVSPANAPSLALVRKLGFVEVGSHWDEVDGEELEFELVTS